MAAKRTKTSSQLLQKTALGIDFILLTSIALGFFIAQSVFSLVAISVSKQAVKMAAYTPATNLDVGLKGYWKFDEGAGNVTKNNVTGYLGKINYYGQTSSGWLKPNPPWVYGVNNFTNSTALTFAGFRSYAILGTVNDVGGNQITTSFWLKLSKMPSAMVDPSTGQPVKYPAVLSKEGSYVIYFATATGWGATHPNKDKLIVKYFDTNGTAHDAFNVSSNTFELNRWYNIVWTFNGVTSTLYVNGQVDSETKVEKPIKSSTSNLSLSSFANSLDGGTVDELRIYWRALARSEIFDLYYDFDQQVINYCVLQDDSAHFNEPACQENFASVSPLAFEREPISTMITNWFSGLTGAKSIANQEKRWQAACGGRAKTLCNWLKSHGLPCDMGAIIDMYCNQWEVSCETEYFGLNIKTRNSCVKSWDQYCTMGIPSCHREFPPFESPPPCDCLNLEKENISCRKANQRPYCDEVYLNLKPIDINGSKLDPGSISDPELYCKLACVARHLPACAKLGNTFPSDSTQHTNALDIGFGDCSDPIKAANDFMASALNCRVNMRREMLPSERRPGNSFQHVHVDASRYAYYENTCKEPKFCVYWGLGNNSEHGCTNPTY